MHDFATPHWLSIADQNNLSAFESIWDLDIGWFEEPNVRRGGWSGVSRHKVTNKDGNEEYIFIKRQQNHCTRTWQHPITGIMTFRREFQNLVKLKSFGIPVLDILYFAERKSNKEQQSILISRELTGYTSLEDCFKHWQQYGLPDKSIRNEISLRIATIARRMHQHRMQQNCFMPKHIFIGEIDGEMDIRLIDLEKAKQSWTIKQAMLRDLDTLNRRSLQMSNSDHLRFLLHYYKKTRVDAEIRQTWRKLNALRIKRLRNRQTA